MPKETPPAVRIVPSGQIYRQLFEAQLQLNQSLSRYDSESRINRLRSWKFTHSKNLPLIRLNQEEIQHGILTSRQKTWVGGFPNDPYTENPVQYKQYNDYLNQKLKDSKTVLAEWEVKGLGDLIVSAKQDSDIVNKVEESRRQRHASTLEDMHQALTLINTEMEPLIEQLTSALIGKLAVSDEEIANMLASIEKDENLLVYQFSDFCALWEKIQAHSPLRYNWISEMDLNLKKLETDRMNKIQEIFRSYGNKLQKISYLMLPDLQRFMDKESQMINQTVLSNHRSYADLYVRLILADIQRERTQHITFLRRTEDWKHLNIRLQIESFRDFMKTETVVGPPGAKAIKQNLLSDQEILNTQRLKIIQSLCDMQPPNSTKSAVNKWREDLKKLSEELDIAMQMHMSKLHEQYEQVCQKCLEQVNTIKLTMIEAKICSSHKANQVVDEFMLPLVGKQQKVFEQDLETMQSVLEGHSAKMEEEITALFKFAEGAANVWEMHEIGLAKQEKELQEQMEKLRQQHDQNNQEKEANLDIIMDRMRQDADEMALKDSLVKALTMLDKIRDSYEEFHELQTQTVQNYPTMVKEELSSYDQAICHFFSVSRTLDVGTETDDDDGDGEDEIGVKMNESQITQLKMSSTKVNEAESNTHVHNTSSLMKESIRTSKGTEFYVLQERTERRSVKKRDLDEEGTEADIEQTFLTEMKIQDDEEVIDKPDFIQNIDISSSLLSEVRKAICMKFLEHLDDWSEQAIVRANSVVVAKCEELNSELDLRLHLHQPRPLRSELDVHHVRAAELVMHAERITRHCSGMDQSLTELRSRFRAMCQEHSKLAFKFKEDIEALEGIFVNATKSASLVKLQKQVTVQLGSFMSEIRTSLRQFRQHLDDTLQTLRESNARFIKSFQTFSDGGNFCPEEIVIYRKKLEKMSLMIDSAEGSIMSELEGMESKHLEVATKVATDFEDRFKNHMTDLNFMESVTHWLTNTQVNIKAEVASSNMQAKRLMQMLIDLQDRLAVYDKPNLDREQITAVQLNNTLLHIFDAFLRRSEYLHCGKISNTSDEINTTPAVKSANETNFEKEFKVAITYDGKSTDPSVGIIKGILQCIETSKIKFCEERRAQASKKGLSREPDGDVLDSVCEKSKYQTSSGGSDSGKNIQMGADTFRETIPRKSLSGKISKVVKIDRKYMTTGEKLESGTDGKQDFFAVIQHLLSKSLDCLLTTAEGYYHQKGTRLTTRPQSIAEIFEQYADLVSQKMQSYFHQADKYQNQCLQEFRDQLIRLEQICACVPRLMIADLLKMEMQQLEGSQNKLSEEFNVTLCDLTERQKLIQKQLCPSLGHPHHADDLAALCARENMLHEEYLEAVTKHIREQQECVLEHANIFLEKLVKSAEQQLHLYDGMLVIGDVDKGRVEPKLYPTCDLIRRHNAKKQSMNEEDKDLVPRGRASWIGVPNNQFVIGIRPSTVEVSPTVQTSKTTLAHSATVEFRDKAYQDYQVFFEKNLQQIEEMKDKLLTAEKNWQKFWETSVKKVSSLYNKSCEL